jgi:hypothetical protein
MSKSIRVIDAIVGANQTKATHWVLNANGVGVDTQTITIGGVVFTTVTNIGTTAGNVLLGANQAATLTNLTALINAPETTTATGVALSSENANKIRTILGLTATTTATDMTITSSTKQLIAVSETETNFSWTRYYYSDPFPCGDLFGAMTMQFKGASISSGNGVFTVEVSNDGLSWTVYSRLNSNVTNTNGQTDTRVASVTVNSNASTVVSVPTSDMFAFWRVKVIPTTDGNYSAYILIA